MREILGDIRKENVRANQIVQRHRAMFKHHEMESHRVDLNTAARESLGFVNHEAVRRQVRIDGQLCPGRCDVVGDQVLLEQVIVNLLLNAMDAASTTAVGERMVTLRTSVVDHVVEVSVQDSGPGIASDIIDKVFEPFVTTKADGMGNGLAISRNIVDAHGGAMHARNEAAGGARVWFTVPKARA